MKAGKTKSTASICISSVAIQDGIELCMKKRTCQIEDRATLRRKSEKHQCKKAGNKSNDVQNAKELVSYPWGCHVSCCVRWAMGIVDIANRGGVHGAITWEWRPAVGHSPGLNKLLCCENQVIPWSVGEDGKLWNTDNLEGQEEVKV